MSRREPVLVVALAAGAVGALLLIVFDLWIARLAGVLALGVFVVAGVFAIATPGFLEEDD